MTEADLGLMRLALGEAEGASKHDDVPIGAVVARDGEPLATAGNERELRGDPTAHAEVLAIREAARLLGGWRLAGCELYVTLEPCAMCAGAIVLARIDRVVYGADDPKAGAAGGVFDVLREPRLNHRPQISSGVLADESAALLRSFFATRRSVAGATSQLLADVELTDDESTLRDALYRAGTPNQLMFGVGATHSFDIKSPW